MALARKGRRRIDVDGETYLWWVASDEDCYTSPGANALNVASEDRRLLVRYHLAQPATSRHVTVLGPVFRDVDCRGPWRRFRAPELGDERTITPADVARFIRWCRAGSDAIVEVDYLGNPLR